nr:molybdopterin-dependent oxidoreductase [uncultured Bacillus sp.]
MSSIIATDNGKIVKTNCFECHAKCGVLCHVDKNGKLIKVEGNPEDPRNQGRLCSKGRSAVSILYHPDRINYPMKRVGKRGEGKWERISWDEAMDTIEKKIKTYMKEYGPETIVFGQGTGRGTNQWNHRLGKTVGVNHWCSPAHICLNPILSVSMEMTGMVTIWDGVDFDHSEVQVFWGSNMVWTEATVVAGEINRSRNRNAKIIVIDPNYEHPLASKADEFVQVRPGSDSALAMAWLNIIIEEHLYDEPFCKKWTTLPVMIDTKTLKPIMEADIKAGGSEKVPIIWDNTSKTFQSLDIDNKQSELDPELNGYFKIHTIDGKVVEAKTAWQELRERAAKMPLEKAAEICWVEPKTIYDSARMYATAKSAAITIYQGIEEHTNSFHTIQAINTIIAITGNLDRIGGNLWPPFWNAMLGSRLTGETKPIHWEKKLGNFKLYPNSHPPLIWEAAITGEPYPIKAYIGIQGNPLSWSEQPQKVKKALLNMDFVVFMDYFMSPSCQIADIVLPSAHWTERDYIADELCGRWMFAQQRAVDPLFERRSDITFMRELGRRLDPDLWPWKTDEEMFDFQLEPLGITYAELKESWIFEHTPLESYKYIKSGFPTPSKKAEIYTMHFAEQDIDPLPNFEEPAESPYATPKMAQEYPFILITGRRYSHFYHSAYRGIPYLRELSPEPRLMINDKSAKDLEIKDYDLCWIESPYGKIQMKAQVTEGIHPRVISVPHGWWQGCKELNLPDYPDFIANANILIGDKHHDKITGSPGSRSTLCKVYKA